MPTAKPRIAVTLDQQTFEIIDRLSKLQNASRGSIVADLLASVAEPLGRTVALLEAAHSAPQEVKDGLYDVVSGVHDELLEVSGDSIKQLDLLLSHLGSTPASNTGVR